MPGARKRGLTEDLDADCNEGPAAPADHVFRAVLVLAVPLLLYQGRRQWFYFDDWYFLDPISSLTLATLMEPYWGHWSVLPRISGGTLFSIFGLHSYLPYQIFVVLAHTISASLIYVLMVRAKVHPWIATATAIFFLLFGPGRENIVWAFQTSMTGAVMLGLAGLALADHDGSLDRRDAAALGCGLLAIMSATIGVMLVVATGVAVLLRRGWLPAAAHTLPLAAVYVGWYAFVGRHTPTPLDFIADSPGQYLEYTWGLVRRFYGVTGPAPFGYAFACLSIAGSGIFVLSCGRSTPEWAASIGLLAGGVVFLLSTAFARAGGLAVPFPPDPTPSRYLHVLAAFVLPTIAIAATRALRWSWGPFVYVVAIAICLPGNIRAVATPERPVVLGARTEALVVADVASLFPSSSVRAPVSLAILRPVGWLREQVAAGRVPEPPAGEDELRSTAFAAIAFVTPADSTPRDCPVVSVPTRLDLERGDVLQLLADRSAGLTITDTRRHLSTTFPAESELVLIEAAAPMIVSLAATDPSVQVGHCH